MKHTKRLVALLLLLSMSAGSAFALQTSQLQTISVSDAAESEEDEYEGDEETPGIVNDDPHITSIKNRAEDGVSIRADIWPNYSGLDESAAVYRSTNGSKFKKLNSKRVHFGNGRPGPFFVHDRTVKNGTFYRYKLETIFRDKDTGEWKHIAYSNVASIYHISPIQNRTIKRSSSGKTMTISWDRNCKVDGYHVRYQYRTRNGDWSDYITRKVKGNKNTSLTLKHRTPGKEYLVTIRGYKKYKGKTYYGGYN